MALFFGLIASIAFYKITKKHSMYDLKKEFILKYVIFLLLALIKVMAAGVYIDFLEAELNTVIFVFYGLYAIKELINKRPGRNMMVVHHVILWFLLGSIYTG